MKTKNSRLAGAIISPDSASRSLRSKKSLIAIVIGVICLLLIGGVVYTRHYDTKAASKQKCSDELLRRASYALDTSRTQELQPIVAEIKAIPGYDTDSNCLNVVVTYYINISDSGNATLNMNKLQQVYSSKSGFSAKLGVQAWSMNSLKTGVDALQKADEQLKQNAQIYNSGQTRK